MKKNKKLVIAAVAVVLVIAVFLGVWLAARPKAVEGDKTITVEVVHADQQTKTFVYQTDAEYLGEVLTDQGLIQGEGGYYTQVDGETADWEQDQAYWAFYIGDEYAQTGIDQTPIQDGDEFSLVYTVDAAG